MQGTFFRQQRNTLDVPADLLRRQPRVVQPSPASAAAAPIPASGAGAPAAGVGPAPAAAGPAAAAAAVAGPAAAAAAVAGPAAAAAAVAGPAAAAAAVAGPAAAGVGPAAAAGPAPPAAPAQIIVRQEFQRFSLDENEYFIKEDMNTNIVNTNGPGGYWIVPYIIDATTNQARPYNGKPIPHDLKDPQTNLYINSLHPPRDRNYARLNEHYILNQPNFYSIKYSFLKNALDLAEKMDFDFAIRMQGLQNCNVNAVWSCTDLGFDAYDRSLIMEQFMRGYVGRFLSQVSQKPGRELNPDQVVREAIQMHERFCDAWVKEHKRGLAPLVESCAEALVGNFCDGVLRPAEAAGLTRKQISRMLRRDEIFSPQFGLCLHFFMVKLDQDRTGRNANYKSMFNSMTSNILALKTFENFMRSKGTRLQQFLATRLQTHDLRRFDPLTVDWYGIVTQLHMPSVQYTGVNKRRRGGAAAGADGGMDGGMVPGMLWA